MARSRSITYEVVVFKSGGTRWFLNGVLHREDGPAVEDDSCKCWYINGELHRDGAPAVIWPSGDKRWYIHGKLIAEEFNGIHSFCD